MADEIKNLKHGLRDALKNQVQGLFEVYTYPPDSPVGYPFAYMEVTNMIPITLGGSSFEAEVELHVVLNSALTEQAVDQLDTMRQPLGENSIEAAVEADRTLGGAIDTIRLAGIDRVGHRDFPYDPVAPHYAATWLLVATLQILT